MAKSMPKLPRTNLASNAAQPLRLALKKCTKKDYLWKYQRVQKTLKKLLFYLNMKNNIGTSEVTPFLCSYKTSVKRNKNEEANA
jgi:hypothetical protein